MRNFRVEAKPAGRLAAEYGPDVEDELASILPARDGD
jgi:hypothetical protein